MVDTIKNHQLHQTHIALINGKINQARVCFETLLGKITNILIPELLTGLGSL